MAALPATTTTARAIGWIANPEHAACEAANAWARVALPKLLRTDLGDWFATYIGNCTLHRPDDFGSFLAPAAATRWTPAACRGLPEKRLVVGESVRGYSALLLRPTHAPAGDETSILLVQVDNLMCENKVIQPSAQHEMLTPKLFGPVGEGLAAPLFGPEGGHERRLWVFIRRSLVARKHLVQPDFLAWGNCCPPMITPATSIRQGCMDAPMNAERARGWIPLAPDWDQVGKHWPLPCTPPWGDLVADLERYQSVSAADLRRIKAEHRRRDAIEGGEVLCPG